MKCLFVWVSLLICWQAAAQQRVLVPYRVGDKYGLSDDKGKMLVKAIYDEMLPLHGNYFKSRLDTTVVGTTRTNTGQGNKITWKVDTVRVDLKLYSLFKADTLLIEDAQEKEFMIEKYYIKNSERISRNVHGTIYNLKGKPVFEPKKRIYYNSQGKAISVPFQNKQFMNFHRDVSQLGELSKKQALFSVEQWDDSIGTQLRSVGVYDFKQQKITKWLVENVRHYHIKERDAYSIFCTYEDQKGEQQKVIAYYNGSYEITDVPADGLSSTPVYEQPVEKSELITEVIEDDREIEAPERKSPPEQYKLVGNDLIFAADGLETKVVLPEGAQVIWKSGKTSPTLMYKKGSAYGLVVRGTFQPAVYDSLAYLGLDFIAAKVLSGKWQYGIIDKTGKTLIPCVYDSIRGQLITYDFVSENGSGSRLVFEKMESWPRPGYQQRPDRDPRSALMVYKKGKVGVVTLFNEVIIPVEYDLIAQKKVYLPIAGMKRAPSC